MPNQHTHPPELAEDVIRIRAYLLYEGRGSQPGHELDDWLQAAAEILAQKPAPANHRKTPRAAVQPEAQP